MLDAVDVDALQVDGVDVLATGEPGAPWSGCRPASNAADTRGPRTNRSASGSRGATPSTSTTMPARGRVHRHVAVREPGAGELRRDRVAHARRAVRVTSPGGSSSVPISNSSGAGAVTSANDVGRRGAARGGAARPSGWPSSSRRAAHSADTSRASPRIRANALARSVVDDRAARVQHVERVRALQHVHVRRHRQPRVEHPARLGRVVLEQPLLRVDVGVVEVEPAHLVLGLAERLAVGDARRVLDVLEVADVLQRHDDALDAVGDLHRDRVQAHARRPAGSR